MHRFIFVLLLLFSVAAHSQPPGTDECLLILKESGVEHLASTWCNSKERADCLPLHGGEWCDVDYAVGQESSQLDKRLNDLYKKIIKGVSESQRKKIQESQRAWLKYRGLECEARLGMIEGGDSLLRSNLLNGCINDFTKERVKQFSKEFCTHTGNC